MEERGLRNNLGVNSDYASPLGLSIIKTHLVYLRHQLFRLPLWQKPSGLFFAHHLPIKNAPIVNMKFLPHLSLLGLLAGTCSAQAQPIPLQNPGFEEVGDTLKNTTPNGNGWTGEGTVARSWGDNSSWADVGVSYSLEATNPHSGKSSQRVAITRVGGGAAQFIQTTHFQNGHLYRFAVWLRGNPGSRLTVQYQQAGAPYHNYGAISVGLSAEWQRFSVLARATEDTDTFLMLRATEPLTYFVDDATLDDVTNEVSNQKPQLGNLMPDGSFESGISGGWNARVEGDPRVVWRDLNLKSVAGQTPIGHRFAALQIAPDYAGTITAPVTPMRFGVPHTFSAWVRSSVPNTSLSLELDGTDLRAYPQAGTEWKRVTWAFTPPPRDSYRLRLHFPSQNGAGERTVAVDGAMLEEGAKPSPDYAPAAPCEMTLRAPRPGNIFFPNERGALSVQIAPTPPQNARIALSVADASGHERALPAQKVVVSAAPHNAVSLLLPFGLTQQGIWKLRATLQDEKGQALSLPTEFVWARLPRPKALTNPEQSYFGLHIPFAPVYIGIARNLGQRFVRLHDASMIGKWPIAEPEEGRFEFYDEQVNAAHAAGLAILGMLDGAPRWATTQPREGGYWGIWNIPDKPDALDKWRHYVATVTGHYKGRIDAWEVWNEPWGDWWISSHNPNATPQLYAKFLQAANEEAHRANSGATVVGVDTFSGHDDNWTKPVLAQTGTSAFDVFSFHDYNDALAGGTGSRVENNAAHFRELQDDVGPAKPLWNTEGGPGDIGSFYAPTTGGLPFNAQAAYMVRYDVASLAAGIKHFFVYAVHSGSPMGDPNYRALEHDFAPRPLLAARAVLASLVDGRGTPKTKALARGLTCYAFMPTKIERGGREIDVVWSDGAATTLTVPRGFEALDVWGNAMKMGNGRLSVGAEPIYLRALHRG
ncbi:hypothetical protein IAD21_03068 [Abditibacteriota bacterium]|nr:hypothetical protein IAD21_03068 [Abditibacteriota bacterium]